MILIYYTYNNHYYDVECKNHYHMKFFVNLRKIISVRIYHHIITLKIQPQQSSLFIKVLIYYLYNTILFDKIELI